MSFRPRSSSGVQHTPVLGSCAPIHAKKTSTAGTTSLHNVWMDKQHASRDPQPDRTTISLAELESDLQNNQPMVVEFFAPWCSHCKKYGPSVQEAHRRVERSTMVPIHSIDAATEVFSNSRICKICNPKPWSGMPGSGPAPQPYTQEEYIQHVESAQQNTNDPHKDVKVLSTEIIDFVREQVKGYPTVIGMRKSDGRYESHPANVSRNESERNANVQSLLTFASDLKRW